MDFGWANIKDNFRSRSKTRAANNLGIITIDLAPQQVFRNKDLEKLDAYYECRQYDKLPNWDEATDPADRPIPVRKRAPRFNYSYAKNLCQRVTAKLIGDSVFPTFQVADAPEDQEFIAAVIRESKLKWHLLEPMRRMINTGSVFLRFYISGAAYKFEWYHAKYCYPVFQDNGELQSIEIKYVYEDPNDKDENGTPKQKWFKLYLDTESEIQFDNPEYKMNSEPVFTEVARLDHGLGYVQGEWFRTSVQKDSPDGPGLIEDILEFIDELNYSLSQSSQAVSYNQDPQLAFTNMDESELGNVIRSATKAWSLGRAGDAKFLESNLVGVERAVELRDKVRQNVTDLTRVVILDPEKIVGSAQSAKAMEVLYGPLKDLVDELRLAVQDQIKNLVLKMALTCLIANEQGIPVPISIPQGWKPESMNVTVEWPPIFQQTMEDLKLKVQVGTMAHAGRAISQVTLVRFVAKDFGITNIDEEIQLINAEPPMNPFGTF